MSNSLTDVRAFVVQINDLYITTQVGLDESLQFYNQLLDMRYKDSDGSEKNVILELQAWLRDGNTITLKSAYLGSS